MHNFYAVFPQCGIVWFPYVQEEYLIHLCLICNTKAVQYCSDLSSQQGRDAMLSSCHALKHRILTCQLPLWWKSALHNEQCKKVWSLDVDGWVNEVARLCRSCGAFSDLRSVFASSGTHASRYQELGVRRARVQHWRTLNVAFVTTCSTRQTDSEASNQLLISIIEAPCHFLWKPAEWFTFRWFAYSLGLIARL